MSAPLLTISIVSHGDAEKIARLLASLQRHEAQAPRFQLLLTDNLKDDLPDYDPSAWASLCVIRNARPMGFAKNHNRAFERAEGRYFAILNPDLVFEEAVFERLIAHLRERRADLIAPLIVDENGTVQDSFRSLPTPFEILRRRLPGYRFQPMQPGDDGMIRPDWMAGMFWLMEAETFRRLGGMDERYRLYFEDVDFCTRARLMGMRIGVDAQMRVRHEAQRSSRRNFYYLFLHIQSAVRFFTSPLYRQARRDLRNK